MKILIVSQYWYPENGVPQRRWSWLVRMLTAAGHEVLVIAPPPHYKRNIGAKEWWSTRRYSSKMEPAMAPSGERIIRTGFVPSGNSLTQRVFNQAVVSLAALWVVLKRPGELREYSPDLVIGTIPALPTAVVVQIASKVFKAPYLIDLRDAWPDLLESAHDWNKGTGRRSFRERLLVKGPLQFLRTLTRITIDQALERAAAVIVTSASLGESLSTRLLSATGVKGKPVITIRNAFPPKASFIKRVDPHRSDDCLRVLYAGTLGRAQNLSNALHAAKIAGERGTEIKLRFVGSGATEQRIRQVAEQLQVSASFENSRSAEDLGECYEWADTALVHLTDWEPLSRAVPSKTYELMEMGIHITGVVEGETADSITRYGAGDVVPPEDPEALAQLWIELGANRERLVVPNSGQEWVRQLRDDVPQQLLQLVESLTKGEMDGNR